MTLAEKIEAVLNYNGLLNQIDQTIEEMAELTQALSKFKRLFNNRKSLPEGYDPVENVENIYEELADVQCMIYQMSIPFEDDLREQRIEDKLDRILERINR